MNLYDYKKEYLDNDLLKISIKINQKELYYTFDKKYEEYLVESYDAFLIAILMYAMYNKKSINIDGPISEKLYNNIINQLVPIINIVYPQCNLIRITTKELINTNYNSIETGFGLSCGIDSLSCLDDLYFKQEIPNYKLTYACNFHSGGSDTLEQYRLRLNRVSKFINENTTLKMLAVESNLNDFSIPGFTHEKNHAFKTISFVYLFQKLFKRFYISSGLTFKEYRITTNPISFGWIEGFIIPLLSTENIEMCLHGSNYTRLYKTFMISKNPIYNNAIDVCINSNSKNKFMNCGTCFKCTRTLLTLDCYTNINKYNNIFNLLEFNKIRNKAIKELHPKHHVLDFQLLTLLKLNKKI